MFLLVLQMVAPQIIMLWMQPKLSMFGMQQGADAIEVDSAVVQGAGFSVVMGNAMRPGGPRTLHNVSWDGKTAVSTKIELPQSPLGIVREGDVLWAVAKGCVSRIENGAIVNSYPTTSLGDESRPFIEAGQLTVLRRLQPAGWEKLVFDGQQWQRGGAVNLPADMLQNATTAVVTHGTRSDSCQVVTDGTNLWTLYYCQGELACRPGVLTAKAVLPTDPVSALDMENAADSPWARCQINLPGLWNGLVHRGELVLLAGLSRGGVPSQLFAHTLPVSDLGSQKMQHVSGGFEQAKLLADEQGDMYLLTTSWPFKESEIHRFNGTDFQDRVMVNGTGMPGSPSSMLDFMFSPAYVALSLFPWGLVLVMLTVFGRLMRRYRTFHYAFGHTTIRLAGLWRRALARLVDTFLYAFPMFGVFVWAWWYPEEVANYFKDGWSSPMQMIQVFLVWGLALMVYILFWLVAFSVMEGVWGWSPGKYLCGVRVVRTTLEPLGILRALVRQLLLVIDGLFNYTVGAVMVAVMPKQQRLGDLAADAIVVERSEALAALQAQLYSRR